MKELLAILITSHLLGDVVFPTDWMAQPKGRPRVLLAHTVVVTLCAGVLLAVYGALPPAEVGVCLACTFASHYFIDRTTHCMMPDTLWAFTSNQLLHLAVLGGLASTLAPAGEPAATASWLLGDEPAWFFCALVQISGVIVCVQTGGIVIGKAKAPLFEELRSDIAQKKQRLHDDLQEIWKGKGDASQHQIAADEMKRLSELEDEGFSQGSRYIGYLERGLIMLFLSLGQPMGIGFLLTAKSIFRYEKDLPKKRAEYILIGTLMSFGWALLVTQVTLVAQTLWAASALSLPPIHP